MSRSRYYNHINSEDSKIKGEQRDLKDIEWILKTFNKGWYKHGFRSIKMILENDFNIIYTLKHIRRIMHKYNIVCPHRKANHYKRMANAKKEHIVIKKYFESWV